MLQFRLRKHIAVCGVLKSGWRRTGHVHRALSQTPRDQVEALLQICQGDIGEAQEIAVTNFKFAKCQEDRLYWTRVEALILKQEPTVVMERLSNNKLKRNVTRKRSLMG
jgi:hypothetical protein